MNDLDRLRAEYDRRAAAPDERYTRFNAAHLFAIQRREWAALELLRPFYPLRGKRLLEIGCGGGGVLHEYLGCGVQPKLLHGVDLLEGRLRGAKNLLPHLPIVCADGQNLPYTADSFDLVLQYMAFSSILDDAVKANIAREMLRVVRRSGGSILWYDFWLNPSNPQTRGIRPAEIRRLFPGCTYTFRRVTLAPPLARRLAPIAPLLCYIMEALRIFNTHYLVLIKPSGRSSL